MLRLHGDAGSPAAVVHDGGADGEASPRVRRDQDEVFFRADLHLPVSTGIRLKRVAAGLGVQDAVQTEGITRRTIAQGDRHRTVGAGVGAKNRIHGLAGSQGLIGRATIVNGRVGGA